MGNVPSVGQRVVSIAQDFRKVVAENAVCVLDLEELSFRPPLLRFWSCGNNQAATAVGAEDRIVVALIEIAFDDDPLVAIPNDVVMKADLTTLVVGSHPFATRIVNPVVAGNAACASGAPGMDRSNVLAGQSSVGDMIVFDHVVLSEKPDPDISRIVDGAAGDGGLARDVLVSMDHYRGMAQASPPTNVMNDAVFDSVMGSRQFDARRIPVGDTDFPQGIVVA